MALTIIINLTRTLFPGETDPVRKSHDIGRGAGVTPAISPFSTRAKEPAPLPSGQARRRSDEKTRASRHGLLNLDAQT